MCHYLDLDKALKRHGTISRVPLNFMKFMSLKVLIRVEFKMFLKNIVY